MRQRIIVQGASLQARCTEDPQNNGSGLLLIFLCLFWRPQFSCVVGRPPFFVFVLELASIFSETHFLGGACGVSGSPDNHDGPTLHDSVFTAPYYPY